MLVNVCELVNIVLTALVTGVFFGPWLGLSRSIDTFSPETFLAIGKRMIGNLAPVMPFLMPIAILSTIHVLVLFYSRSAIGFWVTLAGLMFFIAALLITLIVEVPIDNQIKTWTVGSLPSTGKPFAIVGNAFTRSGPLPRSRR